VSDVPATMKAAVFHGPHDVRVEEVPTPTEIGPDEVLMRVDRSAICGTDLHPYEGHMELEEGVILGHEVLGTVVETLVQVMGLKTAWAFLWPKAGYTVSPTAPPHDFALAACCGLPPGKPVPGGPPVRR
jgi:NADPH:quinone reductase-like Zn-dependent oxidoreductase